MNRPVLSLLVGLGAYALYGLAMVLMKYGAAALARPRQALRPGPERRRALVWGVGCLANLAYVGLLGLALGLGQASVISACSGFGLVVNALLSRAILGERSGRREWCGMAVIVGGVALIGLGAAPLSGPPAPPVVDWAAVLRFGALIALPATGALAYTLLRRFDRAALIFGALAGTLGGLSVVLQKLAVDPLVAGVGPAGSLLAVLIVSPAFWAFFVVANGSFAVLQLAYQFGRAVQVVPAMASAMVLVPVCGGVLVFAERLGAAQLSGTALVVGGVLLLSAAERPSAPPAVAVA